MNLRLPLSVLLLLSSLLSVLGAGEKEWLFVVQKENQEVGLFRGRDLNISSDVTNLGVEYEPLTFVYYFLENRDNSPLTDDWVRDVSGKAQVLFRSPLSLLVAVAKGEEAEYLGNLPSGVEIVAASPRTLKSRRSESPFLAKLASAPLVPNDAIQTLVDQVNEADLRSFVEYLSGELSGSPILTRNSFSQDAVKASEWIVSQFSQFGLKAGTQCWDPRYSCNVVGILQGATFPSEVIVLGAHYDSRAANSSSPTQRAPGANDDGSGTGTLLQIAKIIAQSKVQFARTIHFVAFGGEEQGLLGSRAYAELMESTKTNVVAMIQNDMIAYRAPNAGLLCGFPLRYTTPSLTNIAIAATNMYSPTVSTGRNDRCCSDHASFYELGFPATDFSDTHGPIVDPEYHKSGDLVNRPGFDFPQYTGNVKGFFATVAVVAELVDSM